VAGGHGEHLLAGGFRHWAGASFRAVLRFQTPLIKPDGRISRIRLSEKASRFRPREVGGPTGQARQAQHVVQMPVRPRPRPRTSHLVLDAQRPFTPSHRRNGRMSARSLLRVQTRACVSRFSG